MMNVHQLSVVVAGFSLRIWHNIDGLRRLKPATTVSRWNRTHGRTRLTYEPPSHHRLDWRHRWLREAHRSDRVAHASGVPGLSDSRGGLGSDSRAPVARRPRHWDRGGLW